jgi:ADP-heptose:LPS heptosyltransferase
MVKPTHPALVFMNAWGDHLLTLPAVRAFSHIFGSSLRLVCRPGMRSTFYPSLSFDVVCEPPTVWVEAERQYKFDPAAVASALAPVDFLICLNTRHKAEMDRLLELLAPRASLGFHSAYRNACPVDFDKHNSDLAFDLVQAIDPSLRIEDFAGPPDLSSNDVEFAETIRSTLPSNCTVIVVHAETGPDRVWPLSRFRAVLAHLATSIPNLFVLVLGIEDLKLDVGRYAGRVIQCCNLPLSKAIALVGIADMFLGVNSCFEHAADLFRVPGIALFGPTTPHEFGFRFAPHRHVAVGTTMDAISEEDVLNAVESLHNETGCLGSEVDFT